MPIGDLAVHEPDHKRLIAFLKAMEFSSLTRRVAEFSSIDVAEIEPDAKLAVRGGSSPLPLAGEDDAQSASGGGKSAAPSEPALSPPSPASGGGRPSAANGKLTPQALAAARLDIAHSQKFDRSKYETVRSLDRLKAWIERARDQGFVAIDTETTSLDPMQAALCGFSLALAANEACYVPLSHRQGGDGSGGLFQGEVAPDQIPERAALDAIKPLLEDKGVLKIGQNLKFDFQIFAVRGIEIASYDDTLLMSYVVDAGRSDHGLDPLAQRYFNHRTIDFNEVTKAGKTRMTFDCVEIDKATEYAAEDADATLRLWQVLKPRLAAEHMLNVYETLERPLLRVLADMERRGISIDRQVLSRLSGEFAQEAAGLEAEINKLAGETVNVGSPKQMGDILFGKLGATRRHQDQDRAVGDRRARPRRIGRAGPRTAAKNSRLAAGVETEIDLYRRAARLRQPDDAPRAHQLRARRHHDRPAVVVGTEFAEHPDPHRGRPQNPPRLHCRPRL